MPNKKDELEDEAAQMFNDACIAARDRIVEYARELRDDDNQVPPKDMMARVMRDVEESIVAFAMVARIIGLPSIVVQLGVGEVADNAEKFVQLNAEKLDAMHKMGSVDIDKDSEVIH